MANQKGIEYRKKENLKRFFYPQEWLDFYNTIPDKKKIYFDLLMQTGARYHELKMVEIRDIDFERNTILIRHPKTRVGGMKKIKITCTKCSSKINISKNLKFCPICGQKLENASEILNVYNKKIAGRRKELRKVKISNAFSSVLKQYIKKNKLSTNDTFNFPSAQGLRQLMHRKLKKLKVADWQDISPHNIRKTHENYLLATGSNPLSMRMHMGHSIDVAAAHYISANVFTQEEIGQIKMILGNLKV